MDGGGAGTASLSPDAAANTQKNEDTTNPGAVCRVPPAAPASEQHVKHTYSETFHGLLLCLSLFFFFPQTF